MSSKPVATEEMLNTYYSGETIAGVAEKFNIAPWKMYKMLKAAGCVFRDTRQNLRIHPMPPEAHQKMRVKLLGRKRSAKERKNISEAKKCHFNGLNGFGHTKKQNRGYILAYAPDHPKAHADGYVMLHTIIMERHIGRYLFDDEVVHHRNHIRDDNRLENLALMTKKEHRLLHLNERYGRAKVDE